MPLFSRGPSYMEFQVDEGGISLHWCNGIGECQSPAQLPRQDFQAGDRITIIYNHGQIYMYHNADKILLTEMENVFAVGGLFRLGCISGNNETPFNGWKGGMDTMVLFDINLPQSEVEALVNASSPHTLLSTCDSISAYWNLGENGSDNIPDLKGELHGTGENMEVKEH